MTLTGRQICKARGLLKLTRSVLVQMVGHITTTELIQAEDDDGQHLSQGQVMAIRQTLEALGVEFTPEGPRMGKVEP